jgi:outer membrane protein OmpA-like peptidoglycan-associated protein
MDAGGKQMVTAADASGSFSFQKLEPGTVTLKLEADGYMAHAFSADVRGGEDLRPTLTLTKRPKVAQVRVEGKEIRILKQVHFETDSAKILGDSNALIEEIADVLQRTPSIKQIEIQGHTDNTGTREHNLELSDARAKAVQAALTAAGVDASRLTAKGYGQERPVAPNVTAATRARNRRVQLIILDKR